MASVSLLCSTLRRQGSSVGVGGKGVVIVLHTASLMPVVSVGTHRLGTAVEDVLCSNSGGVVGKDVLTVL